MARWARRAQQKGVTAPAAFRQELPRIIDEASRSADDLAIAFASQGITLLAPPYDSEGLDIVEHAYRQHHTRLRDIEVVERLMALFLGEVVVRSHGGQWAIYPGRYYVFSPIVVELQGGGLYVEPFLLCTQLAQKPNVTGARDGCALRLFAANPTARATK